MEIIEIETCNTFTDIAIFQYEIFSCFKLNTLKILKHSLEECEIWKYNFKKIKVLPTFSIKYHFSETFVHIELSHC